MDNDEDDPFEDDGMDKFLSNIDESTSVPFTNSLIESSSNDQWIQVALEKLQNGVYKINV